MGARSIPSRFGMLASDLTQCGYLHMKNSMSQHELRKGYTISDADLTHNEHISGHRILLEHRAGVRSSLTTRYCPVLAVPSASAQQLFNSPVFKHKETGFLTLGSFLGIGNSQVA